MDRHKLEQLRDKIGELLQTFYYPVDGIPEPCAFCLDHEELEDKNIELQAEKDHLEDLVGEKEEEFADYKKTFKSDEKLLAENKRLKEMMNDTKKRLEKSNCPHAIAAGAWIEQALKE